LIVRGNRAEFDKNVSKNVNLDVAPPSTGDSSSPAPGGGGQTPSGSSGGPIKPGGRVQTTSAVNVRDAAGGNRMGTQPVGSSGTVVDDKGKFGLARWKNSWWWKIDYDTGADGWSIQDWLSGL
jgi:hypothetical protein